VAVVRDIGQPVGVETPAPDAVGADTDLDLLRRRLGNVLGHALRTPVATVRGLVESIEPTDQDALVHHEVLQALHRSAARLEQLVDDLLLVSGLETGLPTGPPLREDPAAVACAVAAGLDQPLKLDVHKDDDVEVLVRPDALRWILRSILDNAARYGGGRAELTARSHDGHATLTIVSGPGGAGFTDHDLTHAAEAFYRGERAVLADGARLGVGLTVAARLAEHAGGRVEVRRGASATFVTELELPTP
jgi:two-component system, OmpR family, phosphate regulon sensor histidine kinase PhoR